MRDEVDVRNNGARPNLFKFPLRQEIEDSPAIQPDCGVDILCETLGGIDHKALYFKDISQAINASFGEASKTLEYCREGKKKIEHFHESLIKATRHLARSSLFPIHEFISVYKACWKEEEPRLLRIVSAPARFIQKTVIRANPVIKSISLVKKLFRKNTPDDRNLRKMGGSIFLKDCGELRESLMEGLFKAPHKEYKHETVPTEPIPKVIGGCEVKVPKLYKECQLSLDLRDFSQCKGELAEVWKSAFDLPPDILEVIRRWVKEARAAMSPFERRQEICKGILVLSLQAGAVGFVVTTGGVGATLGFLTASDLLALTAMPGFFALEHMPEKWREKMQSDIIRKWNEKRTPKMIEVIEKNITGAFLKAGESAIKNLAEHLGQAEKAYNEAKRLFTEWEQSDYAGGEIAAERNANNERHYA
jgi:hypothetical protein